MSWHELRMWVLIGLALAIFFDVLISIAFWWNGRQRYIPCCCQCHALGEVCYVCWYRQCEKR